MLGSLAPAGRRLRRPRTSGLQPDRPAPWRTWGRGCHTPPLVTDEEFSPRRCDNAGGRKLNVCADFEAATR
eukprot:9324656-Heterocapsa_arctica.AAC.1